MDCIKTEIDNLQERLRKVTVVALDRNNQISYRQKALRLVVRIKNEIRLANLEAGAFSDTHICENYAEYSERGPAGPGTYCANCGALVYSFEAEIHQRDHDEI